MRLNAAFGIGTGSRGVPLILMPGAHPQATSSSSVRSVDAARVAQQRMHLHEQRNAYGRLANCNRRDQR